MSWTLTNMQVSLTAGESYRVRELLKGATEIKADYEGRAFIGD